MKHFLLILTCILLSATGFSQQSMNITFGNDSIYPFNCPSGTPLIYEEFTMDVLLTGYNITDTFMIKILFGDGTYQTYPVDSANYGGLYHNNSGQLLINSSFSHQYLIAGTFDVTYIVSDMNGNSDSLFHPAELIATNNCSVFIARVFVDNNSNCVYDAGDSLIHNVPLHLYNGISSYGDFDYPYSTYSNIALGINYTAIVDPVSIQQLGYSLTCPASGMINFTSSGDDTLNFAVNCNANYDLGIVPNSYPNYKLNNSSFISLGVTDISCVSKSGSYSINFDPKLNFVYAFTAPSSSAGNTYTWNFSNLYTIGNGQGSIFNMMYCNLAANAVMGDTLCNIFTISPTVGDIDLTNNTVTTCGVVGSPFDPNYKEVSPKGVGANGSILPNTKLTYTIGFQNTGNDTATNVYVMDTLSTDLEVNSIRVLYASHPMQLYIIDGHILKFDFRNIQLPDSGANEMLSHGFIVYEIMPKANLSNGEQIQNTANIYFDWNTPVITNTTLNTINTALGINQLSPNTATIYPNPVTDLVNIDFSKQFNGTIELYDLSGRKISNQHYAGLHFSENVHEINSGVYVIVAKNADGTLVEMLKLVKL